MSIGRALAAMVALGLIAGSCGSDRGSAAVTTPASPPGSSGAPATAPASTATLDVDGRPAMVALPSSIEAAAPLVLLLHGFTSTAAEIDHYLDFSHLATARGMIVVMPEGTRDSREQQFWNAAPGWCCNFERSTVDDVGYLVHLVEGAAARWNVDRLQVFAVGHSNGGFMALALACQRSETFAAVVSYAGSLPLDPGGCSPAQPVSVLQVHGTADTTIAYDGSTGEYPSAAEVVKRWAAIDGCGATPQPGVALDLDKGLNGAETVVSAFTGCTAAVEFWSVTGGGHVIEPSAAFTPALLDWLTAHGR